MILSALGSIAAAVALLGAIGGVVALLSTVKE